MTDPIEPVRPEDIHSLTSFQRNAREVIERLQRSGKPEILTVQGRAVIVVQAAEAYHRIATLAARMETVQGIQEGIEATGDTENSDLGDFMGPLNLGGDE